VREPFHRCFSHGACTSKSIRLLEAKSNAHNSDSRSIDKTKSKRHRKMIKIQAVVIAVIASCALASNKHTNFGGDASGWSVPGRSLKGGAPGPKAPAPPNAKGPVGSGKAGKGKTTPGAPPPQPPKGAKSNGKLSTVVNTGSGNQPTKASKPHDNKKHSDPKVTTPNDPSSGGKSKPSSGHHHDKPPKDNKSPHGGKTADKNGGTGTTSTGTNGSSSGEKKHNKDKTATPDGKHHNKDKTAKPAGEHHNKDKTAKPAGDHTSKPTHQHNQHHHPPHKPDHKPATSPTRAPLSKPSLHPTRKASAAPSPIPTHAPTPKRTQGPTSYPTQAPSPAPSASPSVMPSYMPSDAPSSAPSDMPSSAPSLAPTTDFMQACRCDETGTCLSEALLPGTNLNLCVISRQPFDILTIESAELISGDLVQMVLAPGVGNSTGVFRSCVDQVCTIQTPVPSSYFQTDKTSSMFVHGVVLLQQANHNSRRAIRSGSRQLLQQKGAGNGAAGLISMEFSTSISLGLSSAAIGAGQNPGQDANNSAGHRPPVVAWLLPVLAVALAFAVGLALYIRRRKLRTSQEELD